MPMLLLLGGALGVVCAVVLAVAIVLKSITLYRQNAAALVITAGVGLLLGLLIYSIAAANAHPGAY